VSQHQEEEAIDGNAEVLDYHAMVMNSEIQPASPASFMQSSLTLAAAGTSADKTCAMPSTRRAVGRPAGRAPSAAETATTKNKRKRYEGVAIATATSSYPKQQKSTGKRTGTLLAVGEAGTSMNQNNQASFPPTETYVPYGNYWTAFGNFSLIPGIVIDDEKFEDSMADWDKITYDLHELFEDDPDVV
jgi:hypothetical protein